MISMFKHGKVARLKAEKQQHEEIVHNLKDPVLLLLLLHPR